MRTRRFEGIARTADHRWSADELQVDGGRLLHRIAELASIGRDPRGGVTRPAFSAADRAAIRQVIDWAHESDLRAAVDPAGNLVVQRRDRGDDRPTLLIGSHLDTVVNGGRLDGAYGVLAAVEVLQSLDEAGLDPRLEPVAVAFANEEGALFPQPFWGSLALSGQLGRLPAEPLDDEGNSLREPLRLVGGDLDRLAEAVRPAGSIAAYLELHIEQGPVLESTTATIGVVDAIVGRTMFDVQITGAAGHAGTTPMTGRRDALAAAADVVALVQQTALRDQCQVATVGRLEVEPNSTNVVPGMVRLTAEIRDSRPHRLATAERALRQGIAAVAARTRTEAKVTIGLQTAPTPTDPALRAAVTEAAHSLGLVHRVLSSGAGHDAQIVAAIAPVGMLFVPSRGGVSHVPEEDTSEHDLVAGANVLLRTAAEL